MARKGKYCRFLEAQEVESTPSDGDENGRDGGAQMLNILEGSLMTE